MQCINCGITAKWNFTSAGVADQPYCDRHVPAGYRGEVQLEPLAQVSELDKPKDEPEDEPKDEPEPTPAPKPRARRKPSRGDSKE